MKRISELFFTGINYWSSKNAIKMWDDFDEKSIEQDLLLLKEAKITHLRIFPLWSSFQPLTAEYNPWGIYEYRFGDQPLPDTEAGKAGVSEKACVNFEKFCALAEKYNFKLIVALFTGHMSGGIYAPPVFGGRNHISDPLVIKWQIRFVKYFVSRFCSQKSIAAWDLGNEVAGITDPQSYNANEFFVWCSLIANTIRSCDSLHPVVSGVSDPCDNKMIENAANSIKDMNEICDINTFHPYHIFTSSSDPITSMKPIMDFSFKCRISEDIGGKPAFIQEFCSIGYLNCSYKSEADFYRAVLLSTFANNCHGVMWWCAFDQGKFDFPPYDWNNRGSDYGFFDNDCNPKPIVQENIKFKERLELIPEGKLPPRKTDGVLLVPRNEGQDANVDVLRTAYILGKKANMDLNFSYALDPIPDSKLYIMPSLINANPIPKRRLNELLEKVKQGSILYVSLSKALFRSVPELFGVIFNTRIEAPSSKLMKFKEFELPMETDATYTIESVTAEVLGVDENGTPMFFKHKYGNGYIYLLTAPLEKYLSVKQGAFFDADQPNYANIYRELAETAQINRIADTDNEFICLTEHKIDDDEYYIFAINYSGNPQTAKIHFNKAYEVKIIFGKDICDGEVLLPACDGALYLLKRKKV